MTLQNGYIQVYTGEGKGKTTAAIGLSIRAIGAGKKIYMAQFMKLGNYSEIKALKKLSDFITIEQFGSGNFVYTNPSKEEINLANSGLVSIKKNYISRAYDIIIMDEINTAISCGLINVKEVIKIIDKKSNTTELILTGRDADPEIIKLADLVTNMQEIKHYYQKGVKARLGIDK